MAASHYWCQPSPLHAALWAALVSYYLAPLIRWMALGSKHKKGTINLLTAAVAPCETWNRLAQKLGFDPHAQNKQTLGLELVGNLSFEGNWLMEVCLLIGEND